MLASVCNLAPACLRLPTLCVPMEKVASEFSNHGSYSGEFATCRRQMICSEVHREVQDGTKLIAASVQWAEEIMRKIDNVFSG